MGRFWREIEKVIEEQKSGQLITFLGGNGAFNELAGKKIFFDGKTNQTFGSIPKEFVEDIIPLLPGHLLKAEKLQLQVHSDAAGFAEVTVFVHPLLPPPTLLVLGGGHIALRLVELGEMMGFKVSVVDDRPEFANSARFPQANQVICADFIQTLRTFPITEQTYIVIATRGHRYDQACVEFVINSPAAYFGMIGSKRRVLAMKNYLIEQGYERERLDRLHSPIGLNIGAETPAEIALSIMAEVVSCRRLSRENIRHKIGELEIDRTVIERLAENEEKQIDEQIILAMIIEVKGSAPRKAGTHMLFYGDGRTVGTIGGGCAEAEVRRAALVVLDQGKPRIHTVDLSNDVAAEEGMVCGGVMKVFLARIDIED